MIGNGLPGRYGRMLFALAALLLAAPAAAGETPGSRAEALPPLAIAPGGVTVLALDDRPVVLSRGAGYLLRADTRRWAPLEVRLHTPTDTIDVVVGGGRAALLDRSATFLRTVEIAGLSGDAITGRVLPTLPQPLRSARAAWDSGTLLVAGLAADGAPRLYAYRDTGGWSAEPAWPGGGEPALIAAQNRGRFAILTDGRQWRWSAAAGWRPGARAPGRVTAGSATAIGQAHILYATEGARAGLYSYSTITDAWARLGDLPTDRLVGAAAWGDGVLLAARAPDGLVAWTIRPQSVRQGLSLVDEAIVAAYMLAMLGMGLYFYRRADATSTSEFFLAGRSVPFWAAGLSMFAGTIGSVNYLAYPAKSFETDWQYLMSKATYVVALVVVAIWLAPFFRRLNVVSVYSYLEARFHLAIRLLASALWIILQLTARMGIILYLPALAIHTMTGVDIVACILAVGIFTIVYTALGGMRAVVWTDVVQVFVLVGGALFAIGYIIHDLGMDRVVATTVAFNKTHAMNWSFDLHQPTMWAFIALALLEGVLCFPRDQIVMQRVLATASPEEASWSILTFAAVLLPSAMLFYGIGTALFAFYRAHPAALDPLLPIDAVFPTFIGTQLPRGIVGLVVSGVLAAAMGVLSGIINSVATLVSVDFYERFSPDRTQKQIVRFSEGVSVVVGVIGMALAILLSRLNVHSLLDLTIELGGVFGGSFTGAYPLGMFSTRTNWQGAAIGILVSAVVTLACWATNAFHPYLYLAVAILVTLVVGYLASLFFPAPTRSLEGLTVFTRRPRVDA